MVPLFGAVLDLNIPQQISAQNNQRNVLELLDEFLEPGLVLGLVSFCKATDGVRLFAALWRALSSNVLPGSEYSSIKNLNLRDEH